MSGCKLPIEKMIERCEALRPSTPAEELLLGRLLNAAQHRFAETKSRSLAEEGLSETLFHALIVLLTADEDPALRAEPDAGGLAHQWHPHRR